MMYGLVYLIGFLVFFVGFGSEIRWSASTKAADLIFLIVLSLCWPIAIALVIGFLLVVFSAIAIDEFMSLVKEILKA